ncbi:MAG: glycosyltransferase [Planctomycetes bacterium]|nr:glycosyltransferase [Planctomycetota bacterium]
MSSGSVPPRTIFHVTAEKGFSGGESQVFLLLERLRERGHRCVLVAPPGSRSIEEAARRGLETMALPFRGDLDILAAARLRRLLQRERPDLVHFHSLRAHVVGAPAARLAGVRGVVATRRMDYRISRHPLNRLAFDRCTDLVIAISEAVRDVLLAFGLPASRVRVVHSGIDLSGFDPSADPRAARARAGLPPEGSLVLCAGSLRPRKDQATLLRAFAAIAPARPDARLLLAGEGPERGRLLELRRALGLEETVLLLGERADMPDLLAACDLFVATPRFEGLGVSVLEAMGAGRAVVATEVGGLRESVLPGVTGLLVPPEDATALAQALDRLLGDAPARARMGKAGRERVAALFSAAAMAEGTERVYGEVLGN